MEVPPLAPVSGQPVLDSTDLPDLLQSGVLSVVTRASHVPSVATGGPCARAAPASGQAHVKGARGGGGEKWYLA